MIQIEDTIYKPLFLTLLSINISFLLYKLICALRRCPIRKSPPNDLVLVIIVNKDLKMSKGKVIAQVGHLISKVFRKAVNVDEWVDNGEAKIVLRAGYEEMKNIGRMAKERGILVNGIYDAGRTQVPAGSNTLIGLGPWNKAEVSVFTKDLKMY
ncbi:Peptidyl-tRNA hydrolase [Trachipleistophora hominis]|uniref:peptidyl-tRNA hydrolase n=1 Tax=Trachipleistophora hominis TaxID=72359 RepID=L7JZZ9_TRAHO|nr:Peptidyl-tRNA hydrolase [Trachipleistophora hominis]